MRLHLKLYEKVREPKRSGAKAREAAGTLVAKSQEVKFSELRWLQGAVDWCEVASELRLRLFAIAMQVKLQTLKA